MFDMFGKLLGHFWEMVGEVVLDVFETVLEVCQGYDGRFLDSCWEVLKSLWDVFREVFGEVLGRFLEGKM